MNYSKIALKVLAAKECGLIKTNAQFWGKFENREVFEEEIGKDGRVIEVYERISQEIELSENEGIICIYDDEFPIINKNVKNNGDKPFLLFYKGDISLLNDLNKNVAVIGVIDPDNEIIKRESHIIKKLVENELVVVSGLALGCDSVAHKECLNNNGKTIAILPSQVGKIFPTENRELAINIVEKGGLLISEYYRDPVTKYDAINRFIERDRLQAMFSKAIILVASHRKGEGDSGSRHAMEAAKKYKIERYAMYNKILDETNNKFGLNKDLISLEEDEKIKVLLASSINEIKEIKNSNLLKSRNVDNIEQLKLL